MSYTVENELGIRAFRLEDDAYDYAIKVIKQLGIKSKILVVNEDTL